jgi:hypothetical protein
VLPEVTHSLLIIAAVWRMVTFGIELNARELLAACWMAVRNMLEKMEKENETLLGRITW